MTAGKTTMGAAHQEEFKESLQMRIKAARCSLK
jgi:hypothetical protein